MKKRHLLLAIAAVALVTLVVVPVQAGDDDDPPLGDLAKQKSGAKAKRVITDEDIPSSNTEATAAEETSASKPKEGEEGKQEGKQDKEPKAAATSALQKELDDIKHDEELLKKKLETLQKKAAEATDPFRKNMYEEAIQNQQITLKEFRDKRVEVEKKITADKEKSEPQS